MRVLRVLFPIASLAVLVSCTGDGTTTSTTVPSSAPTSGSAVDPLVPYSPQATPFQERTTGFIPDTLTLPTDGGALYLTPITTTLTQEFVDGGRAMTVYLTVENPGETAWTGTIGTDAQVTDLDAKVFPAVAPAPGDLHPDAERYGGSNHSLLKPVTVKPGGSVSGALVFHIIGGNRAITLRVSLDGGTTWGEWATNLGVF